MAYLTNAEFLQRFDARLVGDLVQDVNTRASSGSLATDTNLTAVLNDASGWVESACFVGQRYTTTDLTTLPTNSLSLLKRLVADIGLVFLAQRRGYSYKDKYPLLEESIKLLDRIRLGERVFDVTEVEKKGNPTSDAVSLVTISLQNPVSGHYRYFPIRVPIYGQS